MSFLDVFLGFIGALIIKDFYDIFIRNPVVSLLLKYKKLVTEKEVEHEQNKTNRNE